jgi:hypothetical protein
VVEWHFLHSVSWPGRPGQDRDLTSQFPVALS